MDDEKNSNNDREFTDCLHYGVCYAIAHGRDPKIHAKILKRNLGMEMTTINNKCVYMSLYRRY